MSKFPISPTAVNPALPSAEEFFAAKTNYNPVDDAADSFYQALNEAVNARQRQPDKDFAAPKQPVSIAKDTTSEYKADACDGQRPDQTERAEKPKVSASSEKDSDEKPVSSDTKQAAASKLDRTDSAGGTKDVADNEETTQDTAAKIDILNAAAMMAMVLTDQQPLDAVNPVPAGDVINPAAAGVAVNPALATDADNPLGTGNVVIGSAVNDSPIPGQNQNPLAGQTAGDAQPVTADGQTQIKTGDVANGNLQQQPVVAPEQAGLSVQEAQTVVQSAAVTAQVAQSQDKLLVGKTNVVKQQDLPVKKTASEPTGDKPAFSELLNGKVEEVKGNATGKTGDSSQKNYAESKDGKAPQLVTPDNGKLSSPLNEKANTQTAFTGHLTAASKETAAEKGPVINLSVIQTQLSVNGNGDKTRGDIAPVLNLNQQPTVQVPSEITASATSHVNREDLFAQIVEKAKIVINNGQSEMEVNLKPEHLGKLQLKVSVVDQTVTAKFVAESQQVKEVIETHLNQLRRDLQDSGVHVDQLLVSVGQQNNGGGFQENAHQQAGFAQNQNNHSSAGDRELAGESESGSVRENRSGGDTLIDLIA